MWVDWDFSVGYTRSLLAVRKASISVTTPPPPILVRLSYGSVRFVPVYFFVWNGV